MTTIFPTQEQMLRTEDSLAAIEQQTQKAVELLLDRTPLPAGGRRGRERGAGAYQDSARAWSGSNEGSRRTRSAETPAVCC